MITKPHVETFHRQDSAQQAAAGTGASAKVEKLPRPKLEEDITDADWNYFKAEWTRYKRSVNLAGQNIVDQLWATMSEDLKRQCHDHGVSFSSRREILPERATISCRMKNVFTAASVDTDTRLRA